MNYLHRLLWAISISLLASSLQAEQTAFPESAKDEDKSVQQAEATQRPVQPVETSLTKGYLGMGINKLPPPIRAHMPSEVAKSQGLIVTQFSDNSPAADDGIKLYDVIISYDSQLIEDPEKMIKMIRDDKPGRIIQFKVVRQGEVLTIPVTMGEQKVTQDMIDLQKTPKQSKQQSIQSTPYARNALPLANRGANAPRQIPTQYQRQGTRGMPYIANGTRQGYSGYAPRQQGYPNQRAMMLPPIYQANQRYQPNQAYNRPLNRYPNQYPQGYQTNSRPPYASMKLPSIQPLAYQNPNIMAKAPAYPMQKKFKPEKHAWGDKRNIWSDFYTGFTGDMWDNMINAPFDAGRMPGGWRAPSLSTPDPVTIGDAVTNQLPPIMEEMGNMTDFSN